MIYLDLEIWKPIKDYPNYEVSNLGRVKTLNYNKTGKEKILKPIQYKNKRRRVNLYKDGKAYKTYIYRLVWESFNGKIEEGMEINHLDENPSNDRLDNLEKCTHKDNMNYGTLQKRKGEKIRKPVKQFTKDGKLVKVWESVTSATKAFNGNHNNIIRSINKGYSAYGYKWEYVCM